MESLLARGQFTQVTQRRYVVFLFSSREIQEINSYHLDTLHGIYETYFPNRIQKTKGEYKKVKNMALGAGLQKIKSPK